MSDTIKGLRGLTADSRDVRPGYLFAALPGTRTDGAAFIPDAVARGATVVLGPYEAELAARAAHVAFIPDRNPRARFAYMAAEFYAPQPKTVVAVTGTNGKTSVVEFTRQIWAYGNMRAASMGTIGIVSPEGRSPLAHTTPDPVVLYRELKRLHDDGVEHVAIEASSHGLDQHRLDGVKIAAAGFTNITRDHMDYHPDFSHYLAAKLRLFDLIGHGGAAVVNADAHHAGDFITAAQGSRHRLFTVGRGGDDLRLLEQAPSARGQRLRIEHAGKEYVVAVPLVGAFQAANVLVAAGLALTTGSPLDQVFGALELLKGAPGRVELVARAKCGADIYVDYAHTPDAISAVLRALRPHVAGRLHIVFGCGGDRDRGKRPLMGAAAMEHADRIVVTDDNPRSEDARAIRAEILPACHTAKEIADRDEAIRAAIGALGEGDALVIAGKGHEEGQIVGTEVRPFSDRAAAIAAAIDCGGCAA